MNKVRKRNRVKSSLKIAIGCCSALALCGTGVATYFMLKKDKPSVPTAPTIVNPLDWSTSTWTGAHNTKEYHEDYAGLDNSYTIGSAESFAHFVRQVNNGDTYVGKTVYLNTNIDLNGQALDSIKKFEGVFDGGFYTIKNGTINGNGLFEETSNATIKNVGLYNLSFTGTNSGALIGKATDTKIEGVYSRLCNTKAGLVGEMNLTANQTISRSFADNNSTFGLIGAINAINDSKLTLDEVYYTNTHIAVDQGAENVDQVNSNYIKATQKSDFNTWTDSWTTYKQTQNADVYTFDYPIQKEYQKVLSKGAYYEASATSNGQTITIGDLSETITQGTTEITIDLIVPNVYMDTEAVANTDVAIKSEVETTISRTNENANSMFIAEAGGALTIGGDDSEAIIIDGNAEETANANYDSGAAIISFTDNLSIGENVTICNNTNNTDGNGGGVAIYLSSAMESDNIIAPACTITGCVAENGGALYIASIDDVPESVNARRAPNKRNMTKTTRLTTSTTMTPSSNYSNNAVSGNGGGVCVTSGNLYMQGGDVSYNTAAASTTSMTATTKCNGGGIYFYNTSYTFTCIQGSVYGNSCSGNGGGIYCYAKQYTVGSDGYGPVSIVKNTAGSDGGGLWLYAATSSSISTATISGNSGGRDGGGIRLSADVGVTHTISRYPRIVRNTASEGGGIYSGSGHLVINGADISQNSIIFELNMGGGIYFGSSSDNLTINAGSITYNTGYSSAGVYSSAYLTTITGGTISNNTSGGSGGGLTLDGAATITGGTISNNTANYSGGGIFRLGSYPFKLDACSVTGNVSRDSSYPGEIYSTTITSSDELGVLKTKTTISINNSKVAENGRVFNIKSGSNANEALSNLKFDSTTNMGFALSSDNTKIQFVKLYSAGLVFNGLKANGSETTDKNEIVSYRIGTNTDTSGNGYSGSDTSVLLPSTYKDKPVTQIGSYAFSDLTSITSINIPIRVTTINPYAFAGCTGLTSITIPNNVNRILKGAFQGCTGLTSVTLGIYGKIDHYAFAGCTGLTSISIPDRVTSIGGSAFSGCSGLTEMVLPFVGGSAKTSTDTNQYPFGYIFGTSSYTGGVATPQPYYESSTSSSEGDTYYIPSALKTVTITGGNILAGAFFGCSNLTSITLPDNANSIGKGAFGFCTGLTSITIPNNVKIIDDSAFTGCTGLTNINIPSSVTRIGSQAFCDCTGLTSITIPSSVTSIEDEAFWSCSRLTSISIPDSVTSIGNSAFRGCSNLESMVLPFVGGSAKTSSSTNQYPFGYIFGTNGYAGGVATAQTYYGSSTSTTTTTTYYIPSKLKAVAIAGGDILYGAFMNCSNITQIFTGMSVDVIGNYAFSNCTSLKYITISNRVTSIGTAAFQNCTGLASIDIPSSVTTIGGSAFSGCTGLTSVSLGYYGTGISTSAFTGCTKIATLTVSSGFVGTAFQGFTSLTTVTLASGVTGIDSYAFQDCSNLSNLALSNTLESIGSYAFSGCSKLGSISLPDTLESIGYYAFYNCSKLANFALPTSIISIGNYAFRDCTSLTTFTIPYQIIIYGGTIGEGLFAGCTGLTSVTMDTSPSTLPAGMFSGCTGLTSITIYTGVTTIGTSAFSGCTGLTSFSIPSGVTTIGTSAFQGCTGLTSITIPDSVTSIGNNAFKNCTGLTNVSLGSGLSTIGTAFQDCTSLSSITIPDGVTSLARSAFSGCTGLTRVTLGSGLKRIEAYTFSDCSSLTSITIPYNVTHINGEYVFRGCTSLTSVIFEDPHVWRSGSTTGEIVDVTDSSLINTLKGLRRSLHKTDELVITYNLNGGALASGVTNPTILNGTEATFTLKNPTKTGFTFLGWIGTNIDTPQTTVTIDPSTVNTDLEFKAVWLEKGGAIKIRFSVDSTKGSLTGTTTEISLIDSTFNITTNKEELIVNVDYASSGKTDVNRTIKAVAKTGYLFKDWSFVTDSNGIMTISPIFGKANTISLTYTNNTGFDNNFGVVVYEKKNGSIVTETRRVYTFSIPAGNTSSKSIVLLSGWYYTVFTDLLSSPVNNNYEIVTILEQNSGSTNNLFATDPSSPNVSFVASSERQVNNAITLVVTYNKAYGVALSTQNKDNTTSKVDMTVTVVDKNDKELNSIESSALGGYVVENQENTKISLEVDTSNLDSQDLLVGYSVTTKDGTTIEGYNSTTGKLSYVEVNGSKTTYSVANDVISVSAIVTKAVNRTFNLTGLGIDNVKLVSIEGFTARLTTTSGQVTLYTSTWKIEFSGNNPTLDAMNTAFGGNVTVGADGYFYLTVTNA